MALRPVSKRHQGWVNEMAASGLSPRTVRWVHSVLKMTLDYAIDDGHCSRAVTRSLRIDRPKMQVHDLRHTYASLARRAGADLRLLQKTMGHASITATAHVYADLYDDELDGVASARRARRPPVRVVRSLAEFGPRARVFGCRSGT